MKIITASLLVFGASLPYFAQNSQSQVTSPPRQREIYTPDGKHVGTVQTPPPTQQRFDLYAPDGRRLGYGQTLPDGRVNIYDTKSNHILTSPGGYKK